MSFEAVEGHERPVAILKRVLANRMLAHAYLFSGEEGVGKKLTALTLAAAVNCREAGVDGGCGTCPSCRKVAALSHPDVHLLSADGDEIKIDQIRQVQNELALKPFEGVKKILIVDGAENMNTASANAFLKTLEEPPGEALIILISAMPQSLLPTIRSRCQEIRFLPLSRQRLAQVLIRRKGMSEQDAWFLAALAQGSMGRGMEMDLEQEKAARREVLSLWAGLGSMTPAELLAQAEAYSKDRDRLDSLVAVGIEWLRDALVLRETGDEKLLVNNMDTALCQQWGGQVAGERMLAQMELFIASRGMLERRVSSQLVAEHLLMNLARG